MTVSMLTTRTDIGALKATHSPPL